MLLDQEEDQKPWRKVVEKDCQARKLNEDAMDRSR